MKVAIEYSGFLRFVQTTVPLLNTFFIADEPIEFYLFFHTWNDVCEYKTFSSSNEDIEFMKQHAHDYYIDSQKEKHFEVHPYQLINSDMTHEEFMNDPRREKWFASHPFITNPQSKSFFEKPSPANGFHFDKSLHLVSLEHDHGCIPYNMNCIFYSMHQASLIANHYSQKK